MVVTFSAEANVTTYNLVIDGGSPIAVTPNADGTATYDLTSLALTPGSHTASADACNASGCSAFCANVDFTVAEAVPNVPVISVA